MSGTFFGTADMDELEDVALSAMSGSAVIRRQTRTASGMGTYSESYPAVGTVPVHIWRTQEVSSRVAGAQVNSIAEWFIAVPNGTDLRETTDWIVYEDTTYQIVHVPVGVTWNPHLRAEAITNNRELRGTA